MLSSICVATITGLPAARQARVSRFWIGGTEVHRQLDPEVAAGDHDAVRGLEDLGEGVDRRRLLDLGEDRRPPVGELARLEDVARPLHEGERQPVDAELQANSRSLRSLGESAASGSTTSGTLTPLRLEISPPTTTSVRACSGEHSMTFSRSLPSLTRSVEPASSAAKISGCGRQTRVASPSAGSRSKRKSAPSLEHHRAGGEGAAPAASAPAGRRGCRSAGRARPRPGGPGAWRRAMSSWVPWLMFRRKTSAPARNRSRIIS